MRIAVLPLYCTRGTLLRHSPPPIILKYTVLTCERCRRRCVVLGNRSPRASDVRRMDRHTGAVCPRRATVTQAAVDTWRRIWPTDDDVCFARYYNEI